LVRARRASFTPTIDVAPRTEGLRARRTHERAHDVSSVPALACPPRAAPPCPFVSSCQPTTRGPPAAVHLQSGQLVRRVHAGCHLAKSRERRDAHTDRASIGVGTCLRLNLEPRRLLYIMASLAAYALILSGTLVNRLHRLRDYRHAQWSKCSSPSPSARRSARRSMTRHLAYLLADRLLIADAWEIARDTDHIGTRPNSCLAVYFPQMSELYLKRLQRVYWLPIR